MSIKLMTAVWESDLPYNLKHIALAYADSAHDDGTNCFPSIAYIAWKTGYQPRSVQAVTRLLESAPYNILIPQGQGPHGENNYIFDVSALPQRSPWPKYQGGAKSAPPPAKSAPLPPAEDQPDPAATPQGVQKTATGGAKSAPDPLIDPLKEENLLDLKTTVPPPPPPTPQPEPLGGGGGGDGLTIDDAFELANILNGVRGSIAKVWQHRHNQPISVLDILAWHIYAQKNKIGAGAIARRLQFAERPTRRLYAAAESYHAELLTHIRELATWLDDDHAWHLPDAAIADRYFDPSVNPGYKLILIDKARQLHGPSMAATATLP